MTIAIPRRADLDAVFLDAGNTLVSMDFERIAREVTALGHPVDGPAVSRAEARARPAISAFIEAGKSTEGESSFHRLLRHVLGACLELGPEELGALARDLAPRILEPGSSDRLWCSVLPGVPESLARLRDAGLRLVVVSNSDGTIDRAMRTAEMTDYFHAVVDSHVVGFEKPDPRIFEHALGLADCDASRVLHVGDMYGADIRGARAAGIQAVLLDPHDDWPPQDCAVARDLAAMTDAILR